MKQHITPEQLNELSKKGKEKLKEQWEPKLGDFFINVDNQAQGNINATYLMDFAAYGRKKLMSYDYFHPLLSIGQMIGFLDGFGYVSSSDLLTFCAHKEPNWLCDALWEATKKKLET